ncbi:unnamed protein product [Diatraea saccharalis]|uniref:Uncharacterized protein n=1 Tax=Diatraea saccharalis TaxID=40085 RepID=A0A9N9WHZ2_9NEOP|nr:unnamed protein product [Diatraea saccharalis]
MSKAQKSIVTGNSRNSNTSSPPHKEIKMDEFKRKIMERSETTTGEYICQLVDLIGDIPKQIYSAMKREVKENLEKTAQTGLTLLVELSKEITKDVHIMEELKGRVRLGKQTEEMQTIMKEEINSITRKMEQQQQELIKHREEKRRNREDEESVTTKFLRMIDYKLENIKSREEALYDRFSDRTLKDNEMSTAIITRKLDTMEENLTAETIELERKIVERLGRKTDTEEKSMGSEMNSDLGNQIRETGREMTLEITKTIDTVLTECMQDKQNTIAYGGTAPENNTAIIINKLGNMETNIKEEITDTRKKISTDIKENTEKISKEIEKSMERETTMQMGIKALTHTRR